MAFGGDFFFNTTSSLDDMLSVSIPGDLLSDIPNLNAVNFPMPQIPGVPSLTDISDRLSLPINIPNPSDALALLPIPSIPGNMGSFPGIPGLPNSNQVSDIILGEITQLLPPLPGIPLSDTALHILSLIPLPSNFTSATPSTYSIRYPMPAIPPAKPSIPAEQRGIPEGANSSGLQKFIASVRNLDFAIQSKYKVQIAFPQMVFSTYPAKDLGGNSIESLLALYCDQASFPGMNIETQTFRVYGPSFERPSNMNVGDARFSFLMDQDLMLRKVFEAWMNLIIDNASYNLNYPVDYLSSGIVIKHLKHRSTKLKGKDEVSPFSVRLIDAFPKTIDVMPLDFGSKEIHRLAVTFSFRKWTTSYTEEEPPFYYDSEKKDYIVIDGVMQPEEDQPYG